MAFLFVVVRESPPPTFVPSAEKGLLENLERWGHPQTPTRLPAYPFPHYSNISKRSAREIGQFWGASPLPSPSSRGILLSHCPPSPAPCALPPPPVSGPRHGGRRMADVRVSAASLTETVKGQEQCLGQPPAPASPSPRGPGPPTRPPATSSHDQTSCISWGVGRS